MSKLEKQNEELKNKYNYLMEQLKNCDVGHMTCGVCEFTDIVENVDVCKIMTCTKCDKSFHFKCKPICCFCNLCSTCNPVAYAQDKSDYYYICENHEEYFNINN